MRGKKKINRKEIIYLTYRDDDFSGLKMHNVWSVNCSNVVEQYINFMHEKASELNIIINPHWCNIMNYEDHNSHLSIDEYESKVKQWRKIKRQWNIDKFISEILKGTKEQFTSIIMF